jgi:NADH-quinone oxidoreductase subunit N
VSEHQTGRVEKPDHFQSFQGLAKTNPYLAFCFTVAMLSMAGIPLTAGFWGKFFVFLDTFNRNLVPAVVIAILMSAIGIYYYFKGIISVYLKQGDIQKIEISPIYQVALGITTLGTLLLGLFPNIVKSLF